MWINVNDILPTITGQYLVTLRSGPVYIKDVVTIRIYKVQANNSKFLVDDWQTVLGWQEVPTPLTGGNHE